MTRPCPRPAVGDRVGSHADRRAAIAASRDRHPELRAAPRRDRHGAGAGGGRSGGAAAAAGARELGAELWLRTYRCDDARRDARALLCGAQPRRISRSWCWPAPASASRTRAPPTRRGGASSARAACRRRRHGSYRGAAGAGTGAVIGVAIRLARPEEIDALVAIDDDACTLDAEAGLVMAFGVASVRRGRAGAVGGCD